MKRKWVPIFLLLLLAGVLAFSASALSQEQALAGSLIRLHVIAASDSQEDQAQKLQVRDAVLETLQYSLNAENAPDAVEQLRELMPQIVDNAQKVLGDQVDITVRLCKEAYPTRNYGTFALPAGEYVSLQVRIGAAEGQNWWCVVYPALCSVAEGREWEDAVQTFGLPETQLRLITQKGAGVKFRFKILEWLQSVKNLF